MQTPEITPKPSPEISEAPVQEMPVIPKEPVESDEKIFAVVGYLAFLFVVPLIAKPKSKFCQLHAKQSMVMFLVTIFVLVVLAAVPLIGSLLTLALFALYILAIYRAFTGDFWKIPVVSMFADKIDLSTLYKQAGLSAAQVGGLKEKMGGVASKVEEGVKKLGEHEEAKPEEEKPVSPSPPPPAK